MLCMEFWDGEVEEAVGGGDCTVCIGDDVGWFIVGVDTVVPGVVAEVICVWSVCAC